MAKILIIEDDELLLAVLESKLNKEGYDVISARDGEEGLQKIKQESPDLVLLDIIMPKMNGLEVMKKVQEDKSLAPPPIIVISNSGQPVELDEARKLGATDWLVKAAFDPGEVLEKVKKVLKETTKDIKKNMAPQNKNSEESTKPLKGSGPAGVKKILIVEDDRFLRDLLLQKLEIEGFNVSVAIDGETGYKKVLEEKPDLVLLDLILPGIDGFQVLEKIKTIKDFSAPVIILSNLGQKEDIERGLQLGARDYIVKAHYTPGEIVEKIKQNL